MGKIFDLSSDVRQQISDAFDDTFDIFKRSCRLVYPPKLTPCSNCRNGHWITGGPMPFTFGVCPLCQSKGVKAVETTENIEMILYLQPSQWVYPLDRFNMNIKDVGGIIQSKAYLYNFPKIKKCDHMEILNLDPYMHFTYKLLGEPIDHHNITQARFCIMVWQRI